MKMRDLKDTPESEKRQTRIWFNDALAAKLENEGVYYSRIRVREYLDDDSIPPYEVGVIVNDKHANYHNDGFHGGQDGKDDPVLSSMTLDAAFDFLAN